MTEFPTAPDLLGALKQLFLSSPGAMAAIPGGFHADDADSVTTFPYLVVLAPRAAPGLLTSTSAIAEVRVASRVYAPRLEDALAASLPWERAVLAAGGLAWAGGWAALVRQVDRGPQPQRSRAYQGQPLCRFGLEYLYRVRRSV